MKKLTRSRDDKWIAGVLGGFAAYTNIDPIVVRLGFIVLLVLTGLFPFVVVYAIAVAMIPLETVITPSTPVSDSPATGAGENDGPSVA